MLSDETSSDSETGRFKGRSENKDEKSRNTNKQGDSHGSGGRSRNMGERHRDSGRRYEREHQRRHSRERRPRLSPEPRHSRLSTRRHSRDRSLKRRSHDRHKTDREQSKQRDYRSTSKDKRRYSRSRSFKSPSRKNDLKETVKKILTPTQKSLSRSDKPLKDKSMSPDFRGKRSVVHKPIPVEIQRRKSISPINLDEPEEDVQSGSYYNMIPAVVKEKSEESSETDSSDDERLRAKLLNLENELQKTKSKKHRKKHKKKTSRSSNDKDLETTVEVTSTTDIENTKIKLTSSHIDSTEVSSTQKIQKECSEEGEISSGEDSLSDLDLRHKLKRSCPKKTFTPDHSDKLRSQPDVCGPALPPHLEKSHKKNISSMEGPVLPPHLQMKNIGPTIPDDMRKTLADSDHHIIQHVSSDEDTGIGPLPAGTNNKWSKAHQHLEERALDMKIRKLDGHSLQKTDIKTREEWMLELPEGKAKYLGLEARKFRAKEGPDMSDRSSWTDTPEQKARKSAGLAAEESADVVLEREARARHIASRDHEQEQVIKKHKKKHRREESLLDMHQKKLKKKKKKEDKEESKERRPFSRDIDLQVNRFDEAQKKSIIKKAQNLDSRFSRGEAKYL